MIPSPARVLAFLALAIVLVADRLPAQLPSQDPAPLKFDESGFVPAGADRIFYESVGKGPALVLIHDGLVHREVRDAQVAFFTENAEAIRGGNEGNCSDTEPSETHIVGDARRVLVGPLTARSERLECEA